MVHLRTGISDNLDILREEFVAVLVRWLISDEYF